MTSAGMFSWWNQSYYTKQLTRTFDVSSNNRRKHAKRLNSVRNTYCSPLTSSLISLADFLAQIVKISTLKLINIYLSNLRKLITLYVNLQGADAYILWT